MSDLDQANTTPADSSLSAQPRYARLESYDGANIGVCIFLSVSDLQSLNIDTDARRAIAYQIREYGSTRVVEISGADPEELDMSTSSITD
ncbi:hypothetical protein JCM18237_28000 [Halorubrum luteum]